MSSEKKLAGVVGFFDDPTQFLHATEKVRDSQFKEFDVYTPYPLHGLDQAQGLKRSFLPYVTFCAGIVGASFGFGFQYWTSVIDWPLNVGGKPFNSWPAFIPVTFEFTILLAGLSTVGAMFFINGLPNIKRRSPDPRLSQDRFAIQIDAPVDVAQATDFLNKTGAKEVRSVFEEGWF